MDLLWYIAKLYYEGLTKPSDIWTDNYIVDNRSGDQIIDDLITKYGGRVNGSIQPVG